MMCAIQTSAVTHRQRHLWESTRVDDVNYGASPNGSQPSLGAQWIEFAKVVLTFQIALR